MDPLNAARLFADQTNDGSYRTKDELVVSALTSIAYSLIALVERLDAISGTPANASGKAIRTLTQLQK